jgi:hypothetical protein
MSQSIEFDRELEVNRLAYQNLREEIRTKYAGQFVALAFGRIVAADSDFERVCRAVDDMRPEPKHSAVFQAEDDPSSELSNEFWCERK